MKFSKIKIIISILFGILVIFVGGLLHKNSDNEVYEPDIVQDEVISSNIKKIEEDGYFEDTTNYKFDEYLKTEHFEIYYSSSNANNKIYASGIISELENNYGRILDYFEMESKNMPIVKINLYDKHEDFKKSVLKETQFGNVDNIFGYSFSADKFYITYEYQRYPSKTAVHEFVHCVTYNFTNIGNMYSSIWLFEGIAMYLSLDKDNYKDKYSDFIESGLPFKEDLNNYTNRYVYGYSLTEYIVTKFGKDKLLELIKNDGDIEVTLNFNNEEFAEGWRKYIETKTK